MADIPDMEDIPDDILNFAMLNDTYESYDSPSFVNLPLAISYFVLSVIGLSFNTLVIYVFLRHAKLRTISNIYIFNLATCDALFLLVLLFIATQEATYSWPFGLFWCKLVLAVEFLSPIVTITFIMVMSIDRCVVLYRPALASKWRKPKVAALLSAAVWAAAFLFALPVALYGYVHDNPNICTMQWASPVIFYIVALCQGFIVFFGPVLVTATCLFMIAVKARPPAQPCAITKYRGSDRSRMTAMLFLVYMVCWLPLQVVSLISLLSLVYLGQYMVTPTYVTVLSTAKGCVNPILYWYLSEDFRESFQRVLCCRKRNGAAEPVDNKQGEHAC